MKTTKITVKIYEPLLKSFDHQLDEVFIKRDAFLNAIIKAELKNLASDMEGKVLSSKARRYISGELKRMGTAQINIVVDKSVVEELNAIVAKSNMVRDAFFNRLILFLRSSDQLLSYLDLPKSVVDLSSVTDLGNDLFGSVTLIEPFPSSPMRAISAVVSDPFYYLNIACEELLKTSIYLIHLPKKFVGFSCYLDDSWVPGTKENANLLSDFDDQLGALENEAFQKSVVTQGATT